MQKESFITIDIANVNCGNDDINKFLVLIGIDYNKVINYLNSIDKDFNPLDGDILFHWIQAYSSLFKTNNKKCSYFSNYKFKKNSGRRVWKATLTALLNEDNDNN